MKIEPPGLSTRTLSFNHEKHQCKYSSRAIESELDPFP